MSGQSVQLMFVYKTLLLGAVFTIAHFNHPLEKKSDESFTGIPNNKYK